jgi:beta-lactamase class A
MFKKLIRKLIMSFIITAAIAGGVYYFVSQNNAANSNKPAEDTTQVKVEKNPKTEVSVAPSVDKEIDAYVLEDNSATIEATLDASTSLPSFMSFSNNQLSVKPAKEQLGGIYLLKFKKSNGEDLTYNVKIVNRPADFDGLPKKVRDYLGTKADDFGVFVYDLKRNKSFNVNGDTQFGPASIIKLPYAILVLRDIDAGKITLDSTYPIQNKLKFSTTDALGVLSNGTQVKIRDYLSNMISQSSNTALLHLDGYLGGTEIINQRIINELHANPYFYLPQKTTANNVGNVLIELYLQRYLKKETNDYLIDLMRHAVPDLKIGVSNGLPDKPGVTSVNKVGFYDTDDDLAYQDAAIVWGEKTDYVIIVLDRKIDWASAQAKIKEISRMVYEELNR